MDKQALKANNIIIRVVNNNEDRSIKVIFDRAIIISAYYFINVLSFLI